MRSTQFVETVTTQLTDLLHAPVTVIDQHGEVVATTEQHLLGSRVLKPQHVHLRIPLQFDNQRADVLIGEPPNGETVSPRLAQALVDLVLQQTADRAAQADQRSLKNHFIDDLLHGRLADEAAILREARLLGLNFAVPRAVILIDATEYVLPPTYDDDAQGSTNVDVQRRAQLMIDSIAHFFQLPNKTIVAYIGDGEIAVLKASNTKSLQTWAKGTDVSELSSSSWANLSALKRAGAALLARLQHDTGTALSVGLGRYHPGVHGIARSYQDARAALSLGQRFHGQNQVHCLDSLGMAAFVGVPDEQTKLDLSTYLLSPLSHAPELLQTLTVFFAQNCCPSATAQQLSVHRNTLSHRLNKITALTGLDPRRFDDGVQIRLALLLRNSQ